MHVDIMTVFILYACLLLFTKVQRYGDVPYYDEVIGSKDEELLYKPRDSRKYVMQKVVEDLDSAIYMLPETKTPYEVNKWTALALKSRATLFEGTFRKYHNLGDWEEMLQQSAAASLELIQKEDSRFIRQVLLHIAICSLVSMLLPRKSSWVVVTVQSFLSCIILSAIRWQVINGCHSPNVS